MCESQSPKIFFFGVMKHLSLITVAIHSVHTVFSLSLSLFFIYIFYAVYANFHHQNTLENLFEYIASPYFSAPSRIVTVKKGDTAILQCEVNGDKPINVLWLRAGKHELNPSTNYR